MSLFTKVIRSTYLSPKQLTAVALGVIVGIALFRFVFTFGNTQPAAQNSTPQPRTNVILIVVDTFSAQHMGLYGYKRDTTPFMGSFFGKKGIIYNNVWSSATWTSPAFASLLRGRYPSQLTVSDVVKPHDTLPQVLRDHGVTVQAFLKTMPNMFGSSIVESIARPFLPEDRSMFSYGENEANYVAADSWIQHYHANKPFFVFIHDTTVHDSYDPPPKYRSLFGGNPANYIPHSDKIISQALQGNQPKVSPQTQHQLALQYDQSIRYLDDLIKKFIHSIPEQTLNHTVIIITADHGEAFGEHQGIYGHGHSTYNDVTKIPLLIYEPHLAKPHRVNQLTSLIDVMPTILDIMHVPPPSDVKLDGMSVFSPAYLKDAARTVFSEMGSYPISPSRMIYTMGQKEANESLSSYLLSRGQDIEVAAINKLVTVIRRPNELFYAYSMPNDPNQQHNLLSNTAQVSTTTQQAIDVLRNKIKARMGF